MKNFMKHIGLLVIAMIAYTGSAYAQFDDVYFDPSKDVYAANQNVAQNSGQRTNSNVGSSSDQSYNYTRNNDRPRMDDGEYAYDDDEYDYYNDDYSSGNYYFDDYAYTRRINRFHGNRYMYDPFMYDDYFMMGGMRSPYGFSGYGSPFFRPGLNFSLGFGSAFGFGSRFGYGNPMGYGSMYGRFHNPYRYGFYDPIMAYNSYGYGYGYGGGMYGNRYPYVYRNNVNHGERPVYYNNGARTSGAGLVPTARDGRIQVRSSGNSGSSDGYVQPTTRTSPRSSDRSNAPAGSVRSSGEQKASSRTSGNTNVNKSPRSSENTNQSPRSNSYTPDRKATTNRVYRTPSKVEQRSSGDRSTYTPRSSSPRKSYTPSKESPRKSYTPSSGSSQRTYTPSSRSSGKDYTPSSRNSGSSVNRSAPAKRSYTPSNSSGSSSTRSSGSSSSSSSSRRSSPR